MVGSTFVDFSEAVFASSGLGTSGATVDGLTLFVAALAVTFSSGALLLGLMIAVVDSAGRIS